MLACLYDVHGNLPALEAVLADARAAGATRYVLGGDYAVFGGWPAETVARLRELTGAVWIRGNVDRWAADPPDFEPIASAAPFCVEALGRTIVGELAALPESAEVADWVFVHASPQSDVDGFAPEASDDDEQRLAGTRPARLMFGHTHVQFTRRAHGVELLNPGSVGVPLDGDHRAAYALVDEGIELRRVEYDWEASAARLREIGGPWTEVIAGRIERAAP